MSLGQTTRREPGSRNEEQQSNYTSSDTQSQRQRILEWLHHETLTTIQAREFLDVMHPAARVQELRGQGYEIVTHWTTSDTGKAKHRVARYVLFVKAAR